jgi:hypothetical protein
MKWNPSREEIEEWLSKKEDEFSQNKTKGLITNIETWK